MVYPIALSVAGWPVLVVGGGSVAERRVLGFLDAEAHVRLVAPDLSVMLQSLATQSKIEWIARPFVEADLAGVRIVVAATNLAEVNAAVVSAARQRGILVNDARDAEQGDFRVPAIHRIGDLTFSVETNGSSPGFARRLRHELADQFDERYARAAETLRSIRAIIHASVPLDRRAAIMERFSELPIEKLAEMRMSERENAVEEALHHDREHRDGLMQYAPMQRVCATRHSQLAMIQTRSVMAKLARAHIASTVLEIRSTGDRIVDQPLTTMGSGIFVNELEAALQDGRADYAVHSCKDLPSMLPAELLIAALPVRADARDAFCSEEYSCLAELPQGARVGTSSPRRRAQLRLLRPDLLLEEIRGNIDTRLRKLSDGEYDAIVLAMAGMERLGQYARFVVPFAPDEFVPAVGQGALAIEARKADTAWVQQLQETLTDVPTECCIWAERAFLAEVRGGCHAPVGAHAMLVNNDDVHARLRIIAIIAAPSGLAAVRGEEQVDLQGPFDIAHCDPLRDQVIALGRRLAARLMEEGGRALLASDAPLSGRRILLGRTQDRPSRIAAALRAVGAQVMEMSENSHPDASLEEIDAILFPSSGSVAVIATKISPRFLADRPVLIAAMGPQSASTASAAGFTPHVVAPEAEIGAFIQAVTQRLLEQDR